MNKLTFFFAISIATLFFSCNSNNNAKEENSSVSGEQLFKINCAQCHRPTEDLTGPALKNVAARWTNKTMLYEFIKDPQSVIVRDEYAKKLFEKWKQAYMQPFPNLTDKEIDSILQYCESAQ
ncbi:MAG: cytochrome c [Ferruginibacter sp.]